MPDASPATTGPDAATPTRRRAGGHDRPRLIDTTGISLGGRSDPMGENLAASVAERRKHRVNAEPAGSGYRSLWHRVSPFLAERD